MNLNATFGRVTPSVIICLCLALSGCSQTLETKYADTRGVSINGIAGFVELLRDSGHKADLWPGPSPQMEMEYDTVIVFHSGFDAIPDKVCRELRDLTMTGIVERCIIVVRDNDAAIDYWRQIRDRSDLSKQDATDASHEYDANLRSLKAETLSEFDAKNDRLYGLKRVDRNSDPVMKSIEGRSGSESFSIEANWTLNRRLEPRESAEVVWRTGDDPLLTVETTPAEAEIIVLASSAPLLNGGLVDPGNRRLAVELARMIPESDRIAVAVSSRWIDNSEVESPGVIQFMKVHPNGWVFGQAIAALLLFCWWKYPIFGRPRRTHSVETARFGRHVEAFGNLLRRSRDVTFAQRRIRDWLGSQKPRTEMSFSQSHPRPDQDADVSVPSESVLNTSTSNEQEQHD